MRRTLLLSATLAVGLLYSLWSARPLWSDVALLIVLAVAVRATWRDLDTAAPRGLRLPALAFLAAYAVAALFGPPSSWRAVLGLVGYGLAWALVGNLLAHGVAREEMYRALVITSQVIAAALVSNWLMHGAPLYAWRFRYETNNALFHWNLLLFSSLAAGVWPRGVTAQWVYVAWYSASRAGALGLLSALTVMRRHRLTVLALSVVVMVSISFRPGLDGPSGVLNDMGRIEAWRLAARMWWESPIVGQGPDTFKSWWLAGGPRVYEIGHAHNVYLNLAAETGALGLAAGAWLAGSLLLSLWRGRRDEWAAGALAGSVALLVQSVADVPTTAPYITLTWLALARLGLGLGHGEYASVLRRGRPGGDDPLQA